MNEPFTSEIGIVNDMRRQIIANYLREKGTRSSIRAGDIVTKLEGEYAHTGLKVELVVGEKCLVLPSLGAEAVEMKLNDLWSFGEYLKAFEYAMAQMPLQVNN